MAIALMRKSGLASAVSAYGMTEANGNPGLRSDCAASVPMRSDSRRVRTRSACVGSGAVDGGSEEACCVIPAVWSRGMKVGKEMAYFVGIVLGTAICGLAMVVGFDRDRAFYPTLT